MGGDSQQQPVELGTTPALARGILDTWTWPEGADLIGESLPTGAKIFIYFVPLTIAVLAILIPLYRERTSKAIEDFKLDFKLNASDELLDNITNGVIKAVEFYKAVQ